MSIWLMPQRNESRIWIWNNWIQVKNQSTWISRRILEKSWKRLPGKWRNSPNSVPSSSEFRGRFSSINTSGLRVQISQPRGRKSRPTSASSTLDLPLLWLPTTATCGSEIVESWLPTGARMSWSLLMIGITDAPIVGAGVAWESIALASSPIDLTEQNPKAQSIVYRERRVLWFYVKRFWPLWEGSWSGRKKSEGVGVGFWFWFLLAGDATFTCKSQEASWAEGFLNNAHWRWDAYRWTDLNGRRRKAVRTWLEPLGPWSTHFVTVLCFLSILNFLYFIYFTCNI